MNMLTYVYILICMCYTQHIYQYIIYVLYLKYVIIYTLHITLYTLYITYKKFIYMCHT